jgi:hypothetical protein
MSFESNFTENAALTRAAPKLPAEPPPDRIPRRQYAPPDVADDADNRRPPNGTSRLRRFVGQHEDTLPDGWFTLEVHLGELLIDEDAVAGLLDIVRHQWPAGDHTRAHHVEIARTH